MAFGAGRDVGIDPETKGGECDAECEDGAGCSEDADAGGAERGEFGFGGHASEHEEDGGEESPGQGEGEGERQDAGDHGEDGLDGEAAREEEIGEAFEQVTENQHDAEDGHRHE